MYYIYHIKGVKWGCTNNLKYRLSQQGYTFCDVFDIIAISDKDTATQKEIQLNKKWGYKSDPIIYSQTIINQQKSTKKRILSEYQLQFIRDNHAQCINQNTIPPGKMSSGQIANHFGVPKRLVNYAIKHYLTIKG